MAVPNYSQVKMPCQTVGIFIKLIFQPIQVPFTHYAHPTLPLILNQPHRPLPCLHLLHFLAIIPSVFIHQVAFLCRVQLKRILF